MLILVVLTISLEKNEFDPTFLPTCNILSDFIDHHNCDISMEFKLLISTSTPAEEVDIR